MSYDYRVVQKQLGNYECGQCPRCGAKLHRCPFCGEKLCVECGWDEQAPPIKSDSLRSEPWSKDKDKGKSGEWKKQPSRDKSRSKDIPSGLSALGGGEEEADEASPARRPLGNSPNDQDDSPKFYFRTKGGMVEDLDPELRDILKQNLMDIGCLFLDSDTIESAGKKMCIRTGTEPTPSEQQCEGCSFALYGLKIVKSIIKHRKRI